MSEPAFCDLPPASLVLAQIFANDPNAGPRILLIKRGIERAVVDVGKVVRHQTAHED